MMPPPTMTMRLDDKPAVPLRGRGTPHSPAKRVMLVKPKGTVGSYVSATSDDRLDSLSLTVGPAIARFCQDRFGEAVEYAWFDRDPAIRAGSSVRSLPGDCNTLVEGGAGGSLAGCSDRHCGGVAA